MPAFACGFLFSIGLGLSGMTNPTKVVGFLDLFGRWDPTLAFVMAGAVGVHALLFRIIRKRAAPVLVPTFEIPSKTAIDWPLLVGSATFGFGWGASGYCPGPMIVSLPTAAPGVLAFAAGTLLGMGAYGALFRKRPAITTSTGGAL
jgi:uncharacterized membrane protein YedE/YeeE